MNIIIGKFGHRFHHNRKLLHARNILDDVKLRPANRHMPKEVQEQIVSGAHAVNVSDGRILRARISRDHHVAFFFRLHELLGDVALHNFVSEIPAHRLATERIDLKALLQCKTAGLESNVHKPRAREVSVGENSEHEKRADTTQAS